MINTGEIRRPDAEDYLGSDDEADAYSDDEDI